MKKNLFTHLLQASLMCCLAVLFTACDEVFGSEDNPIPAYLSMDTSDVTIMVDGEYTRKAIAVSDAVVEYTSSNPAVATVNQQGTVKGIAVGDAVITATATGYSTGGKKMFITASVSYNVTVQAAAPPTPPTPSTPGLLAGKFTINGNATNNQVQFSQGNLQATYDGTSWTWAFAEHQWDCIGNAAGNTSINGNGTISGTGTVDLFGWVGASNTTWTGAAKYGISNSNTTGDANTYGNVAAEALRSDWGNTMDADWSNKTGASTSGWRTLTKDEWTYLFNTRTTTSGIRYAKATVNGKVGVILLPDDWNASYYALTSANTPGAAYTTNAITSDDWTNKLEAHGAVFLPAAGRRDGSGVSYVGNAGGYWSSPYTTSAHLAYCVYFTGGNLKPADYNNRFYGFSVRLVRDVTTAP